MRQSARIIPRVKGFARQLRKATTPHEEQLWALLRDRRFVDFKFRRQVPIGPYVADFACYRPQVVMELDGSQHSDDPTDAIRDAELSRRGFRVLRFWNNDLTENRDGVLEAIFVALNEGSE